MTDLRALRSLFLVYRWLERGRSLVRRLVHIGLLVLPLGLALAACASAGRSPAADGYVVRAAKALQEGDLDDAEATLRLALELAPDCPEAHADLGLVLSLRGQLASAEDEFARAVVLDPDLAVAHLGLGNVRATRGDSPAAERAYVAALRIQPELVEARRNLVRLLLLAGRLVEARAHAMRLVQLTPDVPGDVGLLVYAELRLGRVAAGRLRLDRAIADLGPSDELAFVDALLRIEEGQPERALPVLERLCAHPSLGADAAVRRVALLLDLGRREEARAAFRALDPALTPEPARGLLAARLGVAHAENPTDPEGRRPRRGLDPVRTGQIP